LQRIINVIIIIIIVVVLPKMRAWLNK